MWSLFFGLGTSFYRNAVAVLTTIGRHGKGTSTQLESLERRPSSRYCIVRLSEHGGGAHLGRHSVTVDGHEKCCGYVDGVRCPVASALPARRHPIEFPHSGPLLFFQTFFSPQFSLY